MKQEVECDGALRIVLMDSITEVSAQDAGSVAVSGSHGGVSSGGFALEVPLKAAFFSDAGVGKDDAGIAALAMLQERGMAAGAVSHTSARIGDARDVWEHGEIAHLNAAARALGLQVGERLREALARLARE
ncbi:hypothetical protein WG922_01960 [Ramlibacter sp. AN1015]|uniref:hypothetical protein n=1 Tax=Ramlibacter sp. AN1015 TaxID=3133428 RepID=UPI0030BD489F